MRTKLPRYIAILTSITALLIISGCSFAPNSNSQSDAESLKKIEAIEKRIKEIEEEKEEAAAEMEKTEELNKNVKEEAETKGTEETTETKVEVKKKETVKAPIYTGPSYIRITSPEAKEIFRQTPIKFTGETSINTLRITVKATTPTSPLVDDYTLTSYKAGSKTFNYAAKKEWNNLSENGTNTYIFTAYFADGSHQSIGHTIYHTAGGAEMGKPVIYLYPEQETKVFVNVKPNNGITITEPELGEGWNVIATPEGKITNLADNKTYPYLFWEGFASNFTTPEEGFVVSQAEVANLFDEKLSYMGLNSQEIADFKEYWVPKLEGKPYYFITFIDQDTFDEYAPLTISPKPDSIIRVFFDYKGLDHYAEVPTQTLKQGVREGFTVTEWGGRLYR